MAVTPDSNSLDIVCVGFVVERMSQILREHYED